MIPLLPPRNASTVLREQQVTWDAPVAVPSEADREACFALWLHRLSGQDEIFYDRVEVSGSLTQVRSSPSSGATFAQWKQALAAGIVSKSEGALWGWGGRGSQGLGGFSWQDRRVSFHYPEGLFSAAEAVLMVNQYVSLVRQAVESPTVPVEQWSLRTTTEPDPRLILQQDLPASGTTAVPELIAEQARRSPLSVAVEMGAQSWSYQDLENDSRDLARSLRAAGLLPGSVVAVSGPRSYGFVAAMLGVLRSGGVLLTIDDSLPEARQALMLESARASFAVVVGTRTPGWSAGLTILCVAVGGAFQVAAGAPADEVDLPHLAESAPAYLFFTSGSTGKPKAVLGRHGGLAHFLTWQRARFAVTPRDRASQVTALSFDVILRDTFLILTAGGTLCLPDPLDIIDPPRLVAWLAERKVTVVHVVPSLGKAWIRGGSPAVSRLSVRLMFFAGEPLPETLVAQWQPRLAQGAQIVNLYGPTETTLAKCFCVIPETPFSGIQPVGQPLPETQVFVFDALGQPCAWGEPGQVVIRTPHRTLGYLDNPEAQKAAFRPNPWTTNVDDLLYFTGDRGYLRSDGLLFLQGRLDDQVKIRGVRVEPAEVTAVLSSLDAVAEAFVMAFAVDEEKQLVAFVVPWTSAAAPEGPIWWNALKERVRDRLPPALVPQKWIQLSSLPLNANGKVDRRALLELASSTVTEASESSGATNSPLADQLVRIWCRLLGLATLGLEDDFFDLGGHSLLAAQMMHEVKLETGKEITVPMLFRSRTIGRLVHEFSLQSFFLSEPAVLPLQAEGEGPALFCVCGLHIYQEFAQQFSPEIPVYGMFLPFEHEVFSPESDKPVEFRSIEAMAKGFIQLIKERQPHGPYLICGISFGGIVAYEVGCQLSLLGDSVEFVGLMDSMLPGATRRRWFRWALSRLWRRLGLPAWKKWLSLRKPSASKTNETEGTPAAYWEMKERRDAYYTQAERAYRAQPSSMPVVLARASVLELGDRRLIDPTYGWGSAASRLSIVPVTGDHLGILKGENAKVLAQAFRPFIVRARGLASPPR